VKIKTPNDIKTAVRAALVLQGRSRHSLVQQGIASRVWTRHTGECLLADDATHMGQRVPTIVNALAFLDLAGLELVVREKTRNPLKDA